MDPGNCSFCVSIIAVSSEHRLLKFKKVHLLKFKKVHQEPAKILRIWPLIKLGTNSIPPMQPLSPRLRCTEGGLPNRRAVGKRPWLALVR